MTEVEPQRPALLTAGHHLRRMTGRDPDERSRVATPLELLFDLTFVVAFGASASEFAGQLAADHVGAGLVGFAFTTFAVCWAWVNFSWFSSAYDTDDWGYRLTTMLQMVGVVIVTMGIRPVYSSIEEGDHVDNRVLVAGYVVMRIAMVFQWLRAARQDKARRRACLTYAITISAAQCGWGASIFLHTSVSATMAIYIALMFVETLGPWIAESRSGGTPWHAHHIAERYSLLTIIALGEGVFGTVASLTAVVAAQGWTVDAVLVALAGIALTFGMWWAYFVLPAGAILHAHRDRSLTFGYGHIVIFATIVATGAGLQAAAYFLDHQSRLDSAQTVLTVGVPVGVYIVGIFALYAYLVRGVAAIFAAVLLFVAGVLVAAVLLAVSGIAMAVCLLVVTMAPIAVVINFETIGYRHEVQAVARALRQPRDGDEASTEPPSAQGNDAMRTSFRRIVTGHDDAGKTIIASDAPPMRVVRVGGDGGPTLYEVWNTRETPARIDRRSGERGESGLVPAAPNGGTRIRVIEFPSEGAEFRQLGEGEAPERLSNTGAAEASTSRGRHPLIYRAETVDYEIVLEGELTLIVDNEETTVRAGDIVIQRGTNHAWANRSGGSCRIACILVDGEFTDAMP